MWATLKKTNNKMLNTTDQFLINDFFSFFCGKLIGTGLDRQVYEYNHDESLVVKIDVGGRFANVTEWEMWQHISKQRPELTKHFAPCKSISSCGRVMLQKKTEPIKEGIEAILPAFLWDMRICNFGVYEGNIVVHDYSNHILYHHINVEMKKTEWY